MSLKHERLKDDFYRTPAWAVWSLLDRLPVPWGGVWVDPSAGDGAIIRAVHEYYDEQIPWLAIEKRPEEFQGLSEMTLGHAVCLDFLALPNHARLDASFVLGNPPYGLAFEFVQQSLRLYPNAKIAFLLRLGFLASKKRREFMQENTPDIYVLPKRPSFAHGKTDSSEYAWFVWNTPPREAHGRVTILDPPSRERLDGILEKCHDVAPPEQRVKIDRQTEISLAVR